MEIDKNIPVPTSGIQKGRPRKYPIESLEIGDSFLIPYEKDVNKNAMHSRASGSIANFRKKHPEKKFTTRQMEDGIRVWRIE